MSAREHSFRTDGHAGSPRTFVGAISIASILIGRCHVDVRQCIGTAVSFGRSAKIGLSNLAAGTVTCIHFRLQPFASDSVGRRTRSTCNNYLRSIASPAYRCSTFYPFSFISIIRVDVRLVSSLGRRSRRSVCYFGGNIY